MMTGVAAMTTAELREANGLIAEVVGDIRLRKGPEDDVARFQRLYEKALRAVLDGRIGAVESLNFERELRTVLAEAERILGPELAAELEPATRRYLERAFKVGQAIRGVGRTIQTLLDNPARRPWTGSSDTTASGSGRSFPSTPATASATPSSAGSMGDWAARPSGSACETSWPGPGTPPARSNSTTAWRRRVREGTIHNYLRML